MLALLRVTHYALRITLSHHAIFRQHSDKKQRFRSTRSDILGHFWTLKWVEFHNLSAILRQYRHFFTMCPHPPPPGVGHFGTFADIHPFFNLPKAPHVHGGS